MGEHLLGPPASLGVRFASPSSIYHVYHSFSTVPPPLTRSFLVLFLEVPLYHSLLGHGTHDQLCDAVQENLLNSDAEFNTVGQLSALSLQEKGRSQGTSSSAR
ncbi:hypothetical protein BHE74_00047093 [Ensete ventricosum]|nr:hypothetical protein BHE74_00047093 [Ensete ventricosum]